MTCLTSCRHRRHGITLSLIRQLSASAAKNSVIKRWSVQMSENRMHAFFVADSTTLFFATPNSVSSVIRWVTRPANAKKRTSQSALAAARSVIPKTDASKSGLEHRQTNKLLLQTTVIHLSCPKKLECRNHASRPLMLTNISVALSVTKWDTSNVVKKRTVSYSN